MPTKKEVKEAVRAARLAEAQAREAKAVRERKKHQQAMDEAAQSKEQESLSDLDNEPEPKTHTPGIKNPQRH